MTEINEEVLKEVAKSYIGVDYPGYSDVGYCYKCKKIIVSCGSSTGNCVKCNRYVCYSCLSENRAKYCLHNYVYCDQCITMDEEMFYDCKDGCLH